MKFERLGNIAKEIKTGKTPPTINPDYFGDEISWYTPTDLDREKELTTSVRGITQLAIDDKKAIVYKPNTVLIGCIGDIGKIGITRKLSSSNQQITGILTDEKKVVADYLFYWLKANKKLLQNASTSSIVSILNNKQLSEIKINYPEDLNQQIHIANILTKAETLIQQRKQSIALLDEFLKSTFLEMFGDGHNSKYPLDVLVKVATKITDGEHGTVKRVDSGRLYLMARNISTSNTLDFTEVSYINEEDHQKIFKRCNAQKGDLLLVCVGATIGKVAIVPEMEEFSLARSVALIKPDFKKITSQYLLWFFNSEYGVRQIKSGSNEAAQAGLYTGNLKKIKIPIPPIELQNQFAHIVAKTEILKKQCQQSLQQLQQLFGSLSQQAFRGELMKSYDVVQEESILIAAEEAVAYIKK